MPKSATQQLISSLLHYGIPNAMIKIVEEQRIVREDLINIDRDDIEHLFKSEGGFTFRDRKRFWQIIQKFQYIPPVSVVDNFLIVEKDDDTFDPYEITDDVDVKNPDSFQCSKSFVPTVERCESELTNPSRKSSCAGSQSDGENDRGFDLLASVPSSRLVNERSPSHSSKLLSTHFYFRYPVELPPFSSKVMKAFETNTIDSEWQTLLDELTRWILAKKKFSICKRESQAIGQSLYSKYPMIGRDGYRPWSYLCTCIAANLRKEKKRRGLSIIFPAS